MPTLSGIYDCGVPAVSQGRIVGGQEAVPHSISWQVGLVDNGKDYPFCGGSIITPYHILTAAHCTYGSGTTDMQVLASEHDLLSSSKRETRHDVSHVLNHVNYEYFTHDYDYSILTLTTAIDLGEGSYAR